MRIIVLVAVGVCVGMVAAIALSFSDHHRFTARVNLPTGKKTALLNLVTDGSCDLLLDELEVPLNECTPSLVDRVLFIANPAQDQKNLHVTFLVPGDWHETVGD